MTIDLARRRRAAQTAGVVSGEVVLELDDGATVTLRPGDSVVQNGTRHRWRNDGTLPATLAYFICGARHDRL